MIKPIDLDVALVDSGARHVVPLSGGKDSTALAVHLSQNHPQVPFEYVFSDTGAELPETYAYFDRLEHVLDAPVKRVSALELLDVPEKPGRTAFDVSCSSTSPDSPGSAQSCAREMLKTHSVVEAISDLLARIRTCDPGPTRKERATRERQAGRAVREAKHHTGLSLQGSWLRSPRHPAHP